jgi:hypothetical protein
MEWKKDILEKAVANSLSIAQTMRLLGNKKSYRYFHMCIKKYGIDTSHFTGQKQFGPREMQRKPLSEILVKDSSMHGVKNNIKQRIIQAGLLEYKCISCGIDSWKSNIAPEGQLSLHIDHINGDHIDHRIENLRFLCPNCHSQTDTYCGKKNRKHKKKCCNGCGIYISTTSTHCRKCSSKIQKETNSLTSIDWPKIDVIIDLLNNHTYEKVSCILGISSNAIRKYLRRRNITLPKPITRRGY